MMFNFEKLYITFSRYNKPKSFNTCPCCVDENEKEYLLSKHIKKLTAVDLSQYASSVFLTVGGISDFKYFFPRILQLCLEEKFTWPDPEVVFKSISNAKWEAWEQTEKQIVLDLVNQKFDSLLTNNPQGGDIDTWLCAIANIQPNLGFYLDKLIKEENLNAFTEFISWNIDAYTKKKLANGFWEDCPIQEKEVINWMKSSKAEAWLFTEYGMTI